MTDAEKLEARAREIGARTYSGAATVREVMAMHLLASHPSVCYDEDKSDPARQAVATADALLLELARREAEETPSPELVSNLYKLPPGCPPVPEGWEVVLRKPTPDGYQRFEIGDMVALPGAWRLVTPENYPNILVFPERVVIRRSAPGGAKG